MQTAAIEKDSITPIALDSSTEVSVRANNRRTSNNKTSNKNRKRTKNRTKIQNGSSSNSNKNKVIRKKNHRYSTIISQIFLSSGYMEKRDLINLSF